MAPELKLGGTNRCFHPVLEVLGPRNFQEPVSKGVQGIPKVVPQGSHFNHHHSTIPLDPHGLRDPRGPPWEVVFHLAKVVLHNKEPRFQEVVQDQAWVSLDVQGRLWGFHKGHR